MKKLNDAKLITCILKMGKAIQLLEALSERGEQKINFAFARGSDLNDLATSDRLKETEKEIVTVVADDSQRAEELFDFIYEIAEINSPGAGLIYMTSLGYSSTYEVESHEA